jgi:hypothetical protein
MNVNSRVIVAQIALASLVPNASNLAIPLLIALRQTSASAVVSPDTLAVTVVQLSFRAPS